jgi:hypothetical protein
VETWPDGTAAGIPIRHDRREEKEKKMTVAEARELLAALPDDALLCYGDGHQVLAVSQIDLTRANGDADGYIVRDDGDTRVAIVA